jgi:predicted RNase H-like nuclease (RuvC/YqgF family)
MKNNSNYDIQEAAIISVEKSEKNPPETNGAEVLLNLESLIKNHISGIDKRKSDLKKQKEMLSSALTNDETYRTHEEEAKKANKVKAATKSEILKRPENAHLNAKIKELTSEIKEMDAALSDYLREYERLSGSNEIEGDDGEVREIVYVAKLVKRGSRP